ncbi:MAG TPA: GNA1162 family protein [Candidatus Binataceae bacterium]|nr:GNA1162 family protein [Candidatus Binataceae bacterium]
MRQIIMSSRGKLALVLPLVLIFPLAGCSAQNYEARPFFQQEHATETHGKKTIFDRIIETDPGGLDVELASDYEQHPPATIAVLPFTDRGSAQYAINKIPLSFRNKEERDEWAWTDAQRLRKAFVAYFSEREFRVVNPIEVDAVLQAHGINNKEDLEKVSPVQLGKWFNCDAVMFGTVDSYDAYYFALVSGYVVGVSSRMVSTHDGETLMRGQGSRYSLNVMPALDMEDIVINSAESLLQLRDVELARAEEEVARELVIRIPVSDKLRTEMANNAVQRAKDSDEADEQAKRQVPVITASREELTLPPPSTQESQFLQTIAIGDDADDDEVRDPAVDEQVGHLNTASSWQPRGSESFASVSSQQRR